ncbi:SRPBCC domain-containing protein [Flavobacterium sp. J27]|uniref:SRPBCC family protein n=1 Tax=Flavobacterium sp. J27 TaxID=2060419 RepID=UPI00102F4586|nr:SRPBCC domain-containing protein [Flavobacterium sp. J27]
MEHKTKVKAIDENPEIQITRIFDLPVELAFKAYSDAEMVALWMENKVIKLESRKHGSYHFEKKDPQGNIIFNAQGVIHDFVENKKIIRTFEMDHVPFGIQLEFLQFEAIDAHTSKLEIRTLFETVAQRNQLLKMPFAQGLNFAHNRLETIAKKL